MWKLYLLLITILIPREFNFFIGSLMLNPFRVYLVLLAPKLFFDLVSKKQFRWGRADYFLIAICIWVPISLSINTDIFAAIEKGGIFFIETFIPYMLVKQVIVSEAQLLRFAKGVLKFIFVLVITALPELFTGQQYLHTFFGALTGNPYFGTPMTRIGLWRAYGLTDHPIVLGTFCLSGFIIAMILGRERIRYYFYAGISVLGIFISLSSAPLLGFLTQIGMLTWSKIFKGFKSKWLLLFIIFVFIYLMIDFASNRDPFRVVFSYLLFSEHNGYVRYYMWINSFFLMSQSWFSAFFGYGFSIEMFSLIDNYFYANLMRRSVDSFWLVNLLRYGWPMPLLLMGLITSVVSQNRKNVYLVSNKDYRHLIDALFILVVSFTFIAITVHFWGSTSSFYMMMLACASVKFKSRPSNTPVVGIR